MTISAVRTLLHHLFENVLHVESGSNGLVTELKLSISRNLSSRYEDPDIGELLDKCSFLDPRFKTEYLPNKELTLVEDTTSTAPGAPEDESEQPPPPKKAKGLAAILEKMPKT